MCPCKNTGLPTVRLCVPHIVRFSPVHGRSGKTETRVGFLILLILAGISAGILWKQSRFDASIFTASLPEKGASSAPVSASSESGELRAFMPPGFAPMSGPETFGPDTLSDKIDGKAELYLSSGFKGLICQRFVRQGKPAEWLEVFLYDMGDMRSAFSVFSLQKRADAEELSLTPYSYQTPNAVYFVRGNDYVEIIASMEGMAEAMLSVGQAMTANGSSEEEKVGELTLFPPENLDVSSVSLHPTDVFGFSRLDDTFTATYTVDGNSVTAFLSKRKDAGEASELAEAYDRFLLENGGTPLDSDLEIPGVRVVKVFDVFEVIFNKGELFAGVHEADDRKTAETLALALFRGIR